MTSSRCVRAALTDTRPRDLKIINTGFVDRIMEALVKIYDADRAAKELTDK